MQFKVISAITYVQLIAKGTGGDIPQHLNRAYASGRKVNWRKLKGVAIVEYINGEQWEVELHWFEAHGIGRRDEKDKRKLRKLS